MKIRNPRQRAPGIIDCEIEHYSLGWIPHTACEDDESTLQVYARCLNGEAGEIQDDPFPTPSYEQRRRAEYPNLADQLDALWKGGEAEEQMRQQIMAIKQRHPK